MSREKKSKFSLHTPEEQARGSSHSPDYRKQPYQSRDKEVADQKDQEKKETKPEDQCPKRFTYEVTGKAGEQMEACRLPQSYELASGFDHECHDCHYSYGRWLDRCEENFSRNGCCTCTPHCPEGMVLHNWPQKEHEISDFVCLIRALH